MTKSTICLDFDGVIHHYREGWRGVSNIYDPPVPGAAEAIVKLRERFNVVVVSTRATERAGAEAILEWLEEHHIEVDLVSGTKVPAMVYVDDRGLQFRGDWDDTLVAIDSFSHWLRPRDGAHPQTLDPGGSMRYMSVVYRRDESGATTGVDRAGPFTEQDVAKLAVETLWIERRKDAPPPVGVVYRRADSATFAEVVFEVVAGAIVYPGDPEFVDDIDSMAFATWRANR